MKVVGSCWDWIDFPQNILFNKNRSHGKVFFLQKRMSLDIDSDILWGKYIYGVKMCQMW